MAGHVLAAGGDYEPLGWRWVLAFIKRNLAVTIIIGKKLEASRAAAASPKKIRAFLKLFKQT
jgi:hypothetical protein